MCPIISARCYVARYMLSLCMSVCLSVTVWYCMETTGQIELGFRVDASCHLSYTVLKGNAGISKNKGTSFWNCPELQKDFASASGSCCQQNSPMVELVDCTYAGRHVMDKRSIFYTHRTHSFATCLSTVML